MPDKKKIIDEGGPAFPQGPKYPGYSAYKDAPYSGMTLRQWYAGQALAGEMANGDWDGLAGSEVQVAAWCHKLANAMIAEDRKGESATK